ncbi:MAG: type II CAAX prenyl endopeptidase Rce1 family protein [Chloroflexota bacterium]
MQLLKTVVREDWRDLTQQMVQEALRLWRGVQMLAVIAALTSPLVFLLALPHPWENIAYTVLSACLFITYPLWVVLRPKERSLVYAVGATLLLVGATVGGYLLRPHMVPNGDVMASLRTVGGGLVMVVTSWGVLAWAHAEERKGMERLGVTGERWALNALLGAAVGAALGAHLMLARYFAGLGPESRPGWAIVAWQICFWAGLKGLGEELLFRGLGFRLLRESLDRQFWTTAVSLTTFDLLTCLLVGLPILKGWTAVWVLLYLGVMATVNAALREWRHSLVACLACNVCFHTFLLVGLGIVI